MTGPVVRIAPNEVHLNDPDNYDKIYHVGSKYTKDPVFYISFGARDNSWSTRTNEDHRRLRAPLEPFFARRTVLELEDVAQDKAAKLCRVVNNHISKGEPVDLHAGFRAISMDVITEYAFNDCWDQLDRADLGRWFSDMVSGAGSSLHVMQQFPFLRTLLVMVPPWLLGYLNEGMKKTVNTLDRTRQTVDGVQTSIANGEKPRRRTIFHNLLDPELNQSALTAEDLVEEAFSLCVAASDTTGNAMSVATYHVLNNPSIYKNLTSELRTAFPDPNTKLDYTTLEKLPYLTAVIKEALRFVFPCSHPLLG